MRKEMGVKGKDRIPEEVSSLRGALDNPIAR